MAMPNHDPILIVEDNRDDIVLTLHACERNRIANRIVVREDGEAALAFLLNRDENLPALVLLDLNLPKITGIELLRAMRANDRTRTVPVVVLTNSRDETNVRTCYTLGANSYIVKPVEFSQFVECIRQIADYWLLRNEPPPAGDESHAQTTTRSAD
jgi:two-component system response regulator